MQETNMSRRTDGFGWQAQRRVREEPCGQFCTAEGHFCELARRTTVALLVPRGRPGAWLLLLCGTCVVVLVQALDGRGA
jgi:hypothetical protein